jgi:RimJ/RimL family protein N-acetyltransferase
MKLHEKHLHDNDKPIGYLCVLTYPNYEIPFLQYEIHPDYRGQGIASREVPIFLQEYQSLGYNQVTAMVEEDNIASMKILHKNGFIEFCKIKDIITYIRDFRADKYAMGNILEQFKKLKVSNSTPLE